MCIMGILVRWDKQVDCLQNRSIFEFKENLMEFLWIPFKKSGTLIITLSDCAGSIHV